MIDVIYERARWKDDDTGSGGSWRMDGGVYFRHGPVGQWVWIGFSCSAKRAAVMLAKHARMRRTVNTPIGRWRRMDDPRDLSPEADSRTLVNSIGQRLMSHHVTGHEERVAEYTRRADAMRPLFDPPVAILSQAATAAPVPTLVEQLAAFAFGESDE